MGNWHQDLVVQNISDDELEEVIEKTIGYLISSKVISSKRADNVLGAETGYCPGENWAFAVEYPEEDDFLNLWTNGLEIRKGRTVFYAGGQNFESIGCPNCSENNVECDWGELFGLWIDDPGSADLTCKKCGVANSISMYRFEPKWALGNLGFVFWNWPILKESFIATLEEVIDRKIEKVEGKL